MTTTPEGRFDAIRNRGVAVAVLIAAAAVLLIGSLAPADASAATKWLCKPGVKPDPCKGSLKTTVFDSAGNSEVRTAKNAHRPKYDCFYVYPTVSEQPTPNANKDIDPAADIDRPVPGSPLLRGLQGLCAGVPAGNTGRHQRPRERRSEHLRDRLQGRPRGLEELPAQLQQGPRRGPDRPLPGCRHAQPAAQQRDREAQVAAQAADLGDPARRQRDDPQGQGPRRHVQEDSSLPLRQAGRLRDRVLDLQRDPTGRRALRPHDGAFAAVPPGKDPADYKVACTNPADLGGGSATARDDRSQRALPGPARNRHHDHVRRARPDRPTRRGSPRRITTPPGATTPTAPAR